MRRVLCWMGLHRFGPPLAIRNRAGYRITLCYRCGDSRVTAPDGARVRDWDDEDERMADAARNRKVKHE